jgi:hypothetical protein
MSRSPLVVLAALACFALPACGGGGGGAADIDCVSFCTGIVACDTSQTQAECEDTCEKMSGAYRAEVGDRAEACATLSCDAQDACLESAITDCDGDYSGLLRAVCQKQIDCGAEGELADCVAQLEAGGDLGPMACLNDATLNALGSCARDAGCTTFDTDFPACVEARTGISFSDDT